MNHDHQQKLLLSFIYEYNNNNKIEIKEDYHREKKERIEKKENWQGLKNKSYSIFALLSIERHWPEKLK